MEGNVPVLSVSIPYEDRPYESNIYNFTSSEDVQRDFLNRALESVKNKVNSSISQSDRRVEFILFFVISRMCDILNCATLAVIFHPRKIRRVNYLIANLSMTCILLSIVSTIYVADWASVVTNIKGPYLCRILSFLRNLLVAVISLTVLAISYERSRSLQSHTGRLLIRRTFVAIWGGSVLVMFPTVFQRVYVHEPPDLAKCKKIPLFGMVEISIAYELIRFIICHAAVVAYIVFELYKLRSKMKYLYKFRSIQTSKNLLKKIQRVRFVCLFSISFILVWLPTGLLLFLLSIQHRKKPPALQSGYGSSDLTVPLLIVFYLYLMAVPIIILLTNEDVSKLRFKNNREAMANVDGMDRNDNENNGVVSTSDNQNETFALTSCDNGEPKAGGFNNCSPKVIKLIKGRVSSDSSDCKEIGTYF